MDAGSTGRWRHGSGRGAGPLVAALVLLGAAPAAAQDGWSFAVTPYLWFSGITASVDTERFGTVETEESISDVLSALDFAFMGAVEARRGRWSLIGDFFYSDLSSDADTPVGLLFAEARTKTKLTTFSGYAGYRVFEDPKGYVDLLGGFRYVNSQVDLTLKPGLAPRNVDFNIDESWVDPVLGARGRIAFDEHWWGQAAFDVGGFDGSNDFTWQALGTVGYQFNAAWSVQGGYRYLDLQKEMEGLDVELELSGPIVGFTYRF